MNAAVPGAAIDADGYQRVAIEAVAALGTVADAMGSEGEWLRRRAAALQERLDAAAALPEVGEREEDGRDAVELDGVRAVPRPLQDLPQAGEAAEEGPSQAHVVPVVRGGDAAPGEVLRPAKPARREAALEGKAASPRGAREKAPAGGPGADEADARATRIPTRYSEPPEARGPEVRGHSPRASRRRKFRLLEADGDTWRHVATGSGAELARLSGLAASRIYYLAGKPGSTSRDGRWRVEAVV